MLVFKNIFLSFIFSVCLMYSLRAQHEMTLPALTWVPQASYTDITVRNNEYKTSVSIPVLGSLQLNYFNSAFKYNRLVQNNTIDPNSIIPKLKKYNQLYSGGSIDLFALRIQKKNYTLQVSLRDVWTQRFVYTKDLANLIWNGNAAFAGSSANFNNVRFAANYYRELGIGVTKKVNDKFSVGIRAKLLMGIANVTTQQSKSSLYTDPNGLVLNGHSDVTVLTAGVMNSNQVKTSDFLGLNNLGTALDIGARYNFSDKISVAGNLNNIGFIHWKKDVQNYRVNGDYNYTGIAMKDSANIVNANWKNIGDSLGGIFKPKKDTKAYNSWLTPSLYLNGTYLVKKDLNVYVAVAMDFYHSLRGAFTVGATQTIGKTIQATVNYTITPNSYFNIGAGIAVRGGPIQMYLASDNIVAVFDPYSVKYFNVRLGMNIIFGKVDKETN
jgi:hypothetical protein